MDMVVRFQGGNNAGHTVKFKDEEYILHLIPSGILRDDQVCVIGNGLVVDPIALLEEMDGLTGTGIDVNGRLFISDRAHVVFPYHRALDGASEARKSDKAKIGTTKRGIGPTYADKVARVGLRFADLISPAFPEVLAERLEDTNRILSTVGEDPVDTEALLAEYTEAAKRLAPFVTDTVPLINDAIKNGKSILMEGAQGAMLDIDFGTYPYVTSSNTTAGGCCSGTGMPPSAVDRVIGIVKAYTTRVGEGPMPTELKDEIGEKLQSVGGEFGATTGRPRRCGWFDAVVVRYSCMINGYDYLAITKLDVLDEIETIKICVAYECDGKIYDTIPADTAILERCVPQYEEMPGWMEPTTDVHDINDLPEKAKAYVDRLCELAGAELGILSVGPKRESTLRVKL
ncbi:adenylosuccinate synthase [bacterium E08(2017)]|nr:adenylosuccinate synthase [bacterium E08(2017)]